MNQPLPRLHAVTNDDVLALADFTDRATRIASAARAAVHIRSGSLSGRALHDFAKSVVSFCGSECVFVNDRADVAKAVGAAGVHLPSAGLPVASVREIVGPDRWIGRSTHNAQEARRAADEGADYVFLGPIYRTGSHPETEPLGPGVLSVATGVPIIAIGGITPETVPACIASGAYGVAVISALWHARNAASAVRAFSLSFPP